MDYEPPFLETYKTLLQNPLGDTKDHHINNYSSPLESTWELPFIDFGRLLDLDHPHREQCMKEMIEASRQWGFFQLVNHGISQELLESMKLEQMKIFHQPFVNKSEKMILFNNLPAARIYRWGNPFATNLNQLSWSEAFHISLPNISRMDQQHRNFRLSMEAFAIKVAPIAESLVEILAHKVNIKSSYFRKNCLPESCFIRLNRYPPCPIPSKVFGLLPHSDSSFLTIVYQDQVGGLQLMKDGKWIGVKPNPQALIVNIGDMFQALSNGVYKSIKHRVVAAEKVERFSVAYFYCPTDDAVIQNHSSPTSYRRFTFREYRQQTQKDVKQIGDKVGLSRFLA